MTERIAARLFLTSEEAEYLADDLRRAANYGTEWDSRLRAFADTIQGQADLHNRKIRVRANISRHEANCDLADCPRCG